MKKGLLRAAAVLLTVLLLPICTGIAEETFPPSPEPPAGHGTGRPTPAPTEPPAFEITDHVHFPDLYPDFAFQEDKKLLEIWFPNIRDADEALLLYDGQAWMIDCGDTKAGERGARMLRQLGIQKIDTLFNSHMHHDHIDGLAATAAAAKIGEIRICFGPDLTQSGLRMIQTAEELEIPVKEYKDGDSFTMGDGAVKMEVLKNNEEDLDINNQSAVMKITYGESSILFTADMEWLGQEAMMKRLTDPSVLKSDILKYPHHAKSHIFPAFYDAVDPKMVIATSLEGRKDAGQYDIANKGVPAIYTASLKEYFHLITDGEYWLVESVKIKKE